jgi:hypothetical protein
LPFGAGLAKIRYWSIAVIYVVVFFVGIGVVEIAAILAAPPASERGQGSALRSNVLALKRLFSFRNVALPFFLPALLLRS